MKKFFLIILTIFIAIQCRGLVFAQDLNFESSTPNVIGIGNSGVTGASAKTGFLNTIINDALKVQVNNLPTFNVIDLTTGDFNGDGIQDIAAISYDDTNGDGIEDTGTITVLMGANDGTFALPLVMRTNARPVALAVSDIDIDGFDDIAIAEQNGIEVMTGLYLVSGKSSFYDRFGSNALKTASNNRVVSISFMFFDSDPIADLVVAEDNGSNGTIELFLTKDFFGLYSDTGVSQYSFNTAGRIGMLNNLPTDAPHVLTIKTSNLGNPNGRPDIFIATTMGLEVFQDTVPTFTPLTIIASGTQLLDYVMVDVNRDNRTDLVTLDRNTGLIFVYTSNGNTFNIPLVPLNPLPNPIGLAIINFTNDGKPDLAVLTNDQKTGPAITILAGNGNGLFHQQTTLASTNGHSLIQPRTLAVATMGGNRAGQTDDIMLAEATTSSSPGGLLCLSASQNYSPIFLQAFSSISRSADVDNNGGNNDLIMLEQNYGMLFVVRNISADGFPDFSTIMVRDLFTDGSVKPTSVTTFKDALTNLPNLAITISATASGSIGSGQLLLAVNEGGGNFDVSQNYRQLVASSGATNIMSGDFNNDSIDDLCYIDYNSNFATVVLNDGTNLFLDSHSRETGGFIPVSAVLVDVNDDDFLDMVVVNQGDSSEGNQSIVSVLLGQGNGQFFVPRSLLQVPNYGMSIAGGKMDLDASGIPRIIDFNNDGYPDLAVVSTRNDANGLSVPSVTLLINRPDSPGDFNIQPPVPLLDSSPEPGRSFQLEDIIGGPGIMSGRGGQNGFAAGVGGSNFVLAAGDFNADGSTDLVVTGTRLDTTNFRSSIFLLGNETLGTVRAVRPQRSIEYGGNNPQEAGGDVFIGCVVGNFSNSGNNIPDVLHVSLNGRLWIDTNKTSLLNHAPVVSIHREDLNAPMPGGGRKYILTAGEVASIPVSGTDVDGDRLTFKLTPTSTGEQPPSFVTLQDNGDNSANVIINSADINRGPSDAIFRIAVEATDAATSSTGGRLPLQARDYFTIVVHPNTPPQLSAIAPLTVQAGQQSTVNLIISDKENQALTTAITCDKGNFVSIDGTVLTVAPQDGDVGTSNCTVTAADPFGLSASKSFVVRVSPNSQPPTIAPIADQVVAAGNIREVPVSAVDNNGNHSLQFSVVAAPSFVTLTDNGQGTGVLRIAPSFTDPVNSSVTVQVLTDDGRAAQTSFHIAVQNLLISDASFKKPMLYITGSGFGQNSAQVMINGQDVSTAIISQSDSSVTLKGTKKSFHLQKGPNQLTVIVNGTTSNSFVLTIGNK